MTWGCWALPFSTAKSRFWGQPLEKYEPAINLARGFLYKINAPNPFFLCITFGDFQNHWPLQSGELDMRRHFSRIATWNKANPQKYKDSSLERDDVKELCLPWKTWKFTKKIFCRGNSCSTYPVFCEINIICIYLCAWMVAHPQNLYRMRNLQFQPTTTCSLSKIRNL